MEIKIMDKQQISVRGKTYVLRTQEDPLRISQLASTLELRIDEIAQGMKGRPESEIVTFAAFMLAEELDTAEAECAVAKSELDSVQKSLKAAQEKFQAELNAASQAVSQAAKDTSKSDELLVRIAELEKKHDDELFTALESAEGKDMEIKRLTETLESVEKSSAECIKRKESDNLALQEENEALRLKLAEVTDGQMALV